jgi:hypothetical protein
MIDALIAMTTVIAFMGTFLACMAVAMRMVEDRWPWEDRPVFCSWCCERHRSGKGKWGNCR